MNKLWMRLGILLLGTVVACALPTDDEQLDDVEQEGSASGSGSGRSVPDGWDCWTYKGSGSGAVQHLTGDYYDPTNGATRTCPRDKGCTLNTEDTSCTLSASQGNGCWSDKYSCSPDHRTGSGSGSAQ